MILQAYLAVAMVITMMLTTAFIFTTDAEAVVPVKEKQYVFHDKVKMPCNTVKYIFVGCDVVASCMDK